MVIFHSFLYVYQRVSGRISWFPTNWWPLVFLFCLILSVAKSASRGKRFHLQLPPGNAKLRRRLQHLQVITIPGRFMALALPHSKKTKKKKHSTVVQKTPKNSLVSTCFNPVRVAMSTLWLLNLPIFDHSASRHSQLHAPQTSVKQNPWPLYRIWCIVTQKRPKTIVDRFLVGFWFCLSTFPLGQPRFGGPIAIFAQWNQCRKEWIVTNKDAKSKSIQQKW